MRVVATVGRTSPSRRDASPSNGPNKCKPYSGIIVRNSIELAEGFGLGTLTLPLILTAAMVCVLGATAMVLIVL